MSVEPGMFASIQLRSSTPGVYSALFGYPV